MAQDYITPLLSLYAKLNQNRNLNDQYNQLQDQQQQQLQSLSSLYSPNSPYAQVMRQQLDRRDAASGRRSQYGPREVELQAKLATQQGQANQAGLQALYSPQAMAMAQARASSNRSVSDPASLAMYAKMLGGLPNLYNQASDLYRTYDAADKLSKFKDTIAAGTAADDTVDPGLWSSAIGGLDYNYDFNIPTEFSSLGDLSNYAGYEDYINYAASLGDTASTAYDAYDAASTAYDTYNTASTASDMADWYSWMDY